MKKCYRCEVSGEKALLYEGVSVEGLVYVCRKCYFNNKIPLVETKEVDMEKIGRRQSVRERLSVLAGIDKKKEEVKKPEESVELREIIENNFKKNLLEESIVCERLIDHFHWVVMRARRSMKWTQKEFAERIFEPLIVVEHLEKGILPKDYLALIRKVESVLKIYLLKEGERRLIPSHLANESKVSSGLKISDLKKSKPYLEPEYPFNGEKKEEFIELEALDLKEVEKIVGKPLEEVKEKNVFSKVESGDLEPQEGVPPRGGSGGMELSEDEIRKLIFRK